MTNFFDKINKKEILKYLNYRSGEIDQEIYNLIDHAIEILSQTSRPSFFYELYDAKDERIQKFLQGQDLKSTLKDSHTLAFIVATLGQEIETLIRRYSFSNLALSLVLDASASAGVEALMNEICAEIEDKYPNDFATDRFSPGYGDMPLAMQGDFLNLLNASRRVGVRANADGIMIPRKSVTAIMGISKFPQVHRHRGCESCKLFMECEFRRRGENCGYE